MNLSCWVRSRSILNFQQSAVVISLTNKSDADSARVEVLTVGALIKPSHAFVHKSVIANEEIIPGSIWEYILKWRSDRIIPDLWLVSSMLRFRDYHVFCELSLLFCRKYYSIYYGTVSGKYHYSTEWNGITD